MDIELIMAVQRSGGPTAKHFILYVMHVPALYCNRSTKMTCKTANFITKKYRHCDEHIKWLKEVWEYITEQYSSDMAASSYSILNKGQNSAITNLKKCSYDNLDGYSVNAKACDVRCKSRGNAAELRGRLITVALKQ